MSTHSHELGMPFALKEASGGHQKACTAIAAAKPERARRVVVVDDNADCADTLGMALEYLGYEVSICKNGQDGPATVESMSPDFALLDIGLPDISGYELARRIATEPWGRNVKLVAVTGWGTADDRRDTDAAGFHARFIKPFDFEKLDAALRELHAKG